jgi:hypothetical protein
LSWTLELLMVHLVDDESRAVPVGSPGAGGGVGLDCAPSLFP